jgi:hypothetical protein
MPCMIRRVNLVPRQRFRYSYVCSSAMFVHAEDGGSAWGTRVINGDVVYGLVSVATCGSIPWLDEVVAVGGP